jgi:hypothetical protein
MFNIGVNITDIYDLKNGTILIGSYYDNIVALYDANFKMITSLKHLPLKNQLVQPAGICCHPDGSIFMTNSGLHGNVDTVNKLRQQNVDLHVVKSVEQKNKKEHLGDICVQGDKIYVCGSTSITIYNLDLDLLTTHKFEHEPIFLRMIKDVACVTISVSSEERQNCFYRVPSFELMIGHEYTNTMDSLMAHKDLFYIVNGERYSVYNMNGKLVERANRKSFGKKDNLRVGLKVIQNELHEFFFNTNQICRFKLQS